MSCSSVAKLAHHSVERVVKVNAREFACFIPFPSELPPHAKATRVYIYSPFYKQSFLIFICFGSHNLQESLNMSY